MDKRKSNAHSNNNERKVDLTLRLGLAVSNGDVGFGGEISNKRKKMDSEKLPSHSSSDESKVDLTLTLAPTVSNEDVGFRGKGYNKVNFGRQYGPATTHAKTLGSSLSATCAPHGNGVPIMSSSYNQVFWPVQPESDNHLPYTKDEKLCESCGTRMTPAWRKGPSGTQTLCNACGLKHSRSFKRSSN